MEYHVRRHKKEIWIEGKRVTYVGGRLEKAWQIALERFFVLSYTWENAALLGMGASLLRLLKKPVRNFFVLEKDLRMVSLQQSLWSLPPFTLIAGDAAETLMHLPTQNLICVDLFEEDIIPSHLVQPSFVRGLVEKKTPQGLLLWNTLRSSPAARQQSIEIGHLLCQTGQKLQGLAYQENYFWALSEASLYGF
ncbi:MAG: hypothetical protein ACUVRD_02275 [Bacteroidia bacterium]